MGVDNNRKFIANLHGRSVYDFKFKLVWKEGEGDHEYTGEKTYTERGFEAFPSIVRLIEDHGEYLEYIWLDDMCLTSEESDCRDAYDLVDLITDELPSDADWRIGSELDEVRFFSEWAGGDDTSPLAFGNWNLVKGSYSRERGHYTDLPYGRTLQDLGTVLEWMGFSLEWSDCYSTCSECDLPMNTEPTSYCWQPDFYTFESGERVCSTCVEDCHDDIIDELIGNHRRALNGIDIDLESYDLIRLDLDLESGFHEHQDSDPSVIAGLLEDRGVYRYLFEIDSVGQFDTRFSVWVDVDEWNDALENGHSELTERDCDGYSPSAAMKSALANTPPEPPGEGGVVVTQCHADGTATSRRVSEEDFIDGKALD